MSAPLLPSSPPELPTSPLLSTSEVPLSSSQWVPVVEAPPATSKPTSASPAAAVMTSTALSSSSTPAPGCNITRQPVLGQESCTVVCPSCEQTVQTNVKNKPTANTCLAGLGVLCGIIQCCFCCCCFLASGDCEDNSREACVDGSECCEACCDCCASSLVKHHYCPSCEAFIGAYHT